MTDLDAQWSDPFLPEVFRQRGQLNDGVGGRLKGECQLLRAG
jgi:hypothetical protein